MRAVYPYVYTLIKSKLTISCTTTSQEHCLSKMAVLWMLTLWRLAGFGDFRRKTTGLHMALPALNSGAESGRELFKSSKDSAILLVWQKFLTPQQKNLFWVQTTRLAESFELLTGSVVLTRPGKFHHKATCDPAVFARTAWINLGAKVLSKINNFKQW